MSKKARTQFPQIPVIRAADQQQSKFNAAVREALAMMTGTKQDRVLTVRDIAGGALSGLTLTGALIDQGAQPPAGSTGPVQRPTQPTGIKANSGMQSNFLQWDLPTYSGHAYTEIYRFDADSLALAQPVAKVVYVLFSEFVGSNKTYFYWLRHVNVNGVAGPWNASEGIRLQTAIDVEEVLRSLSQKITESQFAQSLVKRIDLIDVANDGGLIAAQERLSEALVEADERLAQADDQLEQSLQSAKNLLQGQIAIQGVQIVALQTSDSQQAQQLTGLSFRTGEVESSVLYLDSVRQDHASRLASIETVNGTQGATISALQSTTSSHATSISRLGAYDTAAGKYSFIKTLEQADASQAGRISTLETDNGTNKSRITAVETVNSTQATKITTLETDNTTNKNKITLLESADATQAIRLSTLESDNGSNKSRITAVETVNATQATKLTLLETDNGTNKSRLVSLETADATQASRIEQLSFSQGDGITAKTLAALSTSSSGQTVGSVVANSTVYTNATGYVEIVGDKRFYTVLPFAVDAGRKYSVRFVVKQLVDSSVANTMKVYGGVACLDKGFISLGNRYCAASSVNIAVASGRKVFEAMITGEGTAATTFVAGTKYVRPMFIVNYSGGNGTVEVESIEIRDITASAAVEDVARAYTDTKTGEIRAERTIKVEADGKVAGIGLIAGGVSGSAIYFSANQIAILPPGGTLSAAKLPFIYDAATGGVYMDTTFIRELTASTIKGGLLNLEQGNIRSLSVFTQLLAPAQFLDEIHLSPALASKLAWVDPSAVQTGGSIKKVVPSTLTTTAVGSFLSGGAAQTVKITGSGPGSLVGTSVFGEIEVQMIRNGAVVMMNGAETQKLQVRSTRANDEALPPNEQLWEWFVENEISAVVSAIASNTTASWSIKVVRVSSTVPQGYFQISATVFEAYASSGGIIASTSWEKIVNKPTTAAGFGLTDVSLVGHAHSAADITAGTLATARGGTGRTDGKVTALATARTLTIGNTGKAFDGSGNLSWSLVDIGVLGNNGKQTITKATHVAGTDDYHLQLVSPSGSSGEVSILMHQTNTFYGQIRLRNDGFHFTDGGSNGYRDVYAANFRGNLIGNASSVTNGVYTTGNQYINGIKEFGSNLHAHGNVAIGSVYARNNLSVGTDNPAAVDRTLHFGYGQVDYYGFRFLHRGHASNAAAGSFYLQRGTVNSWVDVLTVDNGGTIAINNAQLRLRTITDSNHYLAYVNVATGGWMVDGPELVGNSGGRLGTSDGNTALYWGKNKRVYLNEWLEYVSGGYVGLYWSAHSSQFQCEGPGRYTFQGGADIGIHLSDGSGNKQGIIYAQGRNIGFLIPDLAGWALRVDAGGNTFANDFVAMSDRRVKSEVKVIEKAVSKIQGLTGYTYLKKGHSRRQAGYMAQDLEAVLPEGVYEYEGLKQVSNSAVIAILIEAVKELSDKLKEVTK